MKASPSLNLAGYLSAAAEQKPHALAVAFARRRPWGDIFYERKSFRELAEETDRYAHGFRRAGIERGWRVLLMAPPGIEFIASAFAVFKLGAILVLIDPGMGKKNLLECIRQVEPQAMATVPLLQALKFFYPAYFETVRCSVTLGRRWFWGGAAVAKFGSEKAEPFSPVPVGADDPAAIFFTTGSTGLAKGALYLNRMLHAQVRAIKEHLAITQDDVGMPAFAPFVLFSLAMGTCAVLPSMAPTKPARADPRKILDAIDRFGVTYSFGSPAFWKGMGRHCVENGISLRTVRSVMMAGAPAQPEVLEDLQMSLMPQGEIHTPYGATEALPLTCITGREILADTVALTCGGGICVGQPLDGIELRIIEITDEPLRHWGEVKLLPPGEIGEIVVKGAVVTEEYYNRPDQTRLAKIKDGDSIWHRMGDVGYVDHAGRLWFCGRKGHRVVTESGTLFTVPCENIFSRHEAVSRAALVGIGPRPRQRPVIVVELKKSRMAKSARGRQRLADELLDIGSRSELTRGVRDILFHPAFPVDFRHNAKIIREELALWAANRLR